MTNSKMTFNFLFDMADSVEAADIETFIDNAA